MDNHTETETALAAQPQTEAACCQGSDDACRETARDWPTVRPQHRVHEGKDAFVVEALMPGVAAEGVSITFEKNRLEVVGTPCWRDGHEGLSLRHREFAPTRFRQSFVVHEDIDREAVDAEIAHGVLTVRLPRVKPQTQTIPVRSA